MNIDNETGLPELPEGYFWRVGYFSEYRWEYLYARTVEDKNRLQVELIHPETYKKRVKIKSIFGDKYREEDAVNDRVLYKETVRGTKPIAIRNAANRIINRWTRDKEMSSLIGDYPPKKLEAQS